MIRNAFGPASLLWEGFQKVFFNTLCEIIQIDEFFGKNWLIVKYVIEEVQELREHALSTCLRPNQYRQSRRFEWIKSDD